MLLDFSISVTNIVHELYHFSNFHTLKCMALNSHSAPVPNLSIQECFYLLGERSLYKPVSELGNVIALKKGYEINIDFQKYFLK